MSKIDVIGACTDLGLHLSGSQYGAETLINNINKNNINKIKKINYSSNYKKELDKNNMKKNLEELNKFNNKLYNEVFNSLNNNMIPLTLGGDHSLAIGSALASIKKHENLGIIWFDAHGDFNTFETTTTGNIHGLPLAAITGYEKNFLTDFHNGNYYNFKNAVLLGARDIDEPFELNNLNDAGVTIITTEDIKKYGIEAMTEKALSIASNGTNGIHISFDLDVIDCDIAPGVSVPVKNGLTVEAASSFINQIIKNKEKIKSFDLVELNPSLDNNKVTENIATKLLNNLINNL